MIKFRLSFDKNKCVSWLNQMVAEGWGLKKFFGGICVFEPCGKGEYVYDVDFGRFPAVPQDYVDFMEEAGIEKVCQWGFWVFLRKPASEGPLNLYSDVDSQIAYYKKVLRMYKIVSAIELLLFFYSMINAEIAGSPVIWAGVILLLVLTVLIARAAYKTADVLEELNERKTGMRKNRRNRLSPVFAAGMLLNCITLFMKDSVESCYVIPFQLIAIILMGAGLFLFCRNRRDGDEQ